MPGVSAWFAVLLDCVEGAVFAVVDTDNVGYADCVEALLVVPQILPVPVKGSH